MKKLAFTLLNALAVFAALLLCWQGLDVFLHLPPYILPPPLAVGKAVAARFPELVASLGKDEIFFNPWATPARALPKVQSTNEERAQ